MSSYHPEQLLVSSLINSGDVLSAEQYGVHPGLLSQFRTELEWLIRFRKDRGTQPEYEMFRNQFPDFELVNTVNVSFACDLVREHHSRNQLSYLAREIADDLRLKTDPASIVSKITEQLPKIIRHLDGSPDVNDMINNSGAAIDRALERVDRTEPMGIPFVHTTLRNFAWGQSPGDLTVYAARTSQGKSWLLANEAAHAALSGKRVLFWAGEMTDVQMNDRLETILFRLTGTSGYTHRLISWGYDCDTRLDVLRYKRDRVALAEQIPGQIFIPDMSMGLVTPTTLASWVAKYTPDLVVVDHLTLMGDSTGQRATSGWNALASITGELKQLATSAKVPILAASQINREGDSRIAVRPPRLVHLAQSDAVGQDANTVITMCRFRNSTGVLMLSLEKARSSEAGAVLWIRFDPNNGCFDEITRAEAEEIRAQEEECSDE